MRLSDEHEADNAARTRRRPAVLHLDLIRGHLGVGVGDCIGLVLVLRVKAVGIRGHVGIWVHRVLLRVVVVVGVHFFAGWVVAGS
jgi:hypothetical protein